MRRERLTETLKALNVRHHILFLSLKASSALRTEVSLMGVTRRGNVGYMLTAYRVCSIGVRTLAYLPFKPTQGRVMFVAKSGLAHNNKYAYFRRCRGKSLPDLPYWVRDKSRRSYYTGVHQ